MTLEFNVIEGHEKHVRNFYQRTCTLQEGHQSAVRLLSIYVSTGTSLQNKGAGLTVSTPRFFFLCGPTRGST